MFAWEGESGGTGKGRMRGWEGKGELERGQAKRRGEGDGYFPRPSYLAYK